MFLRSLYFSLLTAFVATNANASDFYAGVYVGVADHESKIDVVSEDLDPNLGFDYVRDYNAPDDTETFATIVFGYKLGKDISLELGFSEIGEYEGDERTFADITIPLDPNDPLIDDPATDLVAEEEVDIEFMTISFIGEWPVHQRWAVHGKLGFSTWDYRYTQVLTDLNGTTDEERDFKTESYSDSGTDFIYGAGVAYAINQTFELRLDFEIHSFEPKFNNIKVDTDLTNVAFGVIAHF